MKTKLLLLLVALVVGSTLSATTITVTNVNSSGTGSFAEAYTSATTGDIINFNFDGTELIFTDVIVMKSITIDGLNVFNNQKLILKQATASKSFFSLASGISGTFKNLVFDGTDILGNTGITAVNGSTLNIDACDFKNINAQANNGGAARIQGVANIINSTFQGNTTGGSYGGGALCIYNAADVTINKCSFIGNTSVANGNSGGGAIVARGTAATACNVKITNSTFANNASGKTGGAILSSIQSSTAYTVNVTAVNCTFGGNKGDGAISSLTTAKGTANVYLVNSLVVNNVDAAAGVYSDLLETKGTDAATVALIEPHNVIYSVASSTVVTTDRNCIQVADASTADIFKELETFATDKKRPVLTVSNGQTVAMISSSSIAKNAGVSALTGYTIPTVDQLGETRSSTPAIGAVEFKDLGLGVPSINIDNKITLNIKNREIFVSGITKPTTAQVFSLTGSILQNVFVSDGSSISLQNTQGSIFILRIENKNFKVFVQ